MANLSCVYDINRDRFPEQWRLYTVKAQHCKSSIIYTADVSISINLYANSKNEPHVYVTRVDDIQIQLIISKSNQSFINRVDNP